jgi:hypothetical protein
MEIGRPRYAIYEDKLNAAMAREPDVVMLDKERNRLCLSLEVEYKPIKTRLGMYLAKRSQEEGYLPIGIIRHNTKGNKGNLVSLSFRSLPGFDVSEICRRHGGGGYPQAAKMQINRVNFENDWIKPNF